MIKGKFLLTAVLALFLASCGDDDESQDTGGAEVKFTAGFVPMQTSGASTRLTTNDNWAGLADRTVAVEIDGVVKPYTVDELGNLTSQDPFYWGDKTELTVNAWYPYNEGIKPEIPVVKADQSGSGYWESDHLEVVTSKVTAAETGVAFRHRNTKLVCNIEKIAGLSDNGVSVKFLNLQGVEEGNSIQTTTDCKALVMPQTVLAGTEFMEITLKDYRTYTYTLTQDLGLGEGHSIGVGVEVSEEGMNVTFTDFATWNGGEEAIDSHIPNINPDTNSGDSGWNGDEGETDGKTPVVHPDGGNDASWSGEESDADGKNPIVHPDGGNDASWNGSEEDVNGNKNTTTNE